MTPSVRPVLRARTHPKLKSALKVAMAAGGADGVHRHQHARPGNDPARTALRSPTSMKSNGPDVARRGDAGHQRFLQILGGDERSFGEWFFADRSSMNMPEVVGARKRKMSVRIDQARRKRGVAEIDHLGPSGNRPRQRRRPEWSCRSPPPLPASTCDVHRTCARPSARWLCSGQNRAGSGEQASSGEEQKRCLATAAGAYWIVMAFDYFSEFTSSRGACGSSPQIYFANHS